MMSNCIIRNRAQNILGENHLKIFEIVCVLFSGTRDLERGSKFFVRWLLAMHSSWAIHSFLAQWVRRSTEQFWHEPITDTECQYRQTSTSGCQRSGPFEGWGFPTVCGLCGLQFVMPLLGSWIMLVPRWGQETFATSVAAQEVRCSGA